MEQMVKTERAKIVRTMYGREDHGILTCVLTMEWSGCGQGFGCLSLDQERTGPSFVGEICALFGVNDIEQLVGYECEIGWRFDGWNDPIESIKGPFGEFQINDWRQRMHPGTPSLTEQKRARLRADVEFARRRLNEERARLSEFVDEHYHGDD